nr:phosphoglucan phosphatase LSF2, chloroplastic [Ipomoea batatas]
MWTAAAAATTWGLPAMIRIHLHGGGFGLNQILVFRFGRFLDGGSDCLPKAVSLLEWAISEEPFENLPDHAYEGIADWERTLIQGRVRALCILEEIYACQPCIQITMTENMKPMMPKVDIASEFLAKVKELSMSEIADKLICREPDDRIKIL